LNAKLQYDSAAQLQHQSLADNQEDARAWAQLKLRIATNAATIDHAINAGVVLAGQVGTTEGQQAVSPVRTGTGDAIVGGVGVSAEQIAANVANLATAITPVIVGAVSEAVSATIAAILPALVTAVGGASTPSQTQPKPTPTA
jgi:hypothetical protein